MRAPAARVDARPSLALSNSHASSEGLTTLAGCSARATARCSVQCCQAAEARMPRAVRRKSSWRRRWQEARTVQYQQRLRSCPHAPLAMSRDGRPHVQQVARLHEARRAQTSPQPRPSSPATPGRRVAQRMQKHAYDLGSWPCWSPGGSQRASP